MPWRKAWAESDHLGGTLSATRHARVAIEYGGWRAIALPMLFCLGMAALFVAVAFGAAVLAAQGDSTERSGLLLILASVTLSQLLTLWQGQHPAKRMFVAAATRARFPPTGWGIVGVRVPSARSPEAKRLLQGRFSYVETTYRRHGADSHLRAWFPPGEHGRHGTSLEPDADAALEGVPHACTGTNWW